MVADGHLKGNDSEPIATITNLMAWQISNVPLHLKPSPTYLGIQEQLYEPCVLVQEAFGWHLLISTACASLHSSTSEREHTYYVKIKAQKMSLED